MRRRLVLLVAVTTSLVLVAFLVPLGLLVRTVAADNATSEATREAQEVAPLVGTVDRRALEMAVRQLGGEGQGFPLTVFLPDGTALGAPATTSPAVQLARTGRSLTASYQGGREVLVAAQGAPGGTVVIRAYVSPDQLYSGVARTWLILGLLGAALLALSLLVAARLARTVAAPLERLVQVTHRLAAGDMAARAPLTGPPEVREVATAVNLLAGRVGELLAAEREEVADLSHRLRTPLTAVQLAVEALPPSGERDRLAEATVSLQRTVDLVITEARRPVREGVGAGCDAAAVVAERLAFWSALADDEGRRVDRDIAGIPVPVKTTAADLAAALDALLDNVFAHTPEGAGFRVQLAARDGGGAVLTVADEGPGLPDPAVLDRGASPDGSTGLGLDIVRRTAAAADGDLTLGASPADGAQVTVILGAPASGLQAPGHRESP